MSLLFMILFAAGVMLVLGVGALIAWLSPGGSVHISGPEEGAIWTGVCWVKFGDD